MQPPASICHASNAPKLFAYDRYYGRLKISVLQ